MCMCTAVCVCVRACVHITNNVSFSLELVEESLISDYHDEGPGQGSQSNVETA